ncbi:MAG: DoxX family protein [uncultured bacterium]|nr:MAG: DoxX family protein [uncultured bacterium]
MNEIIKQFMQKISPDCRDEDGNNYPYVVFRLVVSAMFFMHGAQKIFGFFGGITGSGGTVDFAGMIWFAGLIEVVAGILIFVGIFSRLAAVVAIIEMAVAYITAHLPNGINPLLNKGELALMYLVSFLVITRYGSGKWSLEKMWRKKEIF